MTIEIRQLLIRAVVEARPAAAAPDRPPAAPSPAAPPTDRLQPRVEDPEARAELIAACAREVLRELRRSRER